AGDGILVIGYGNTLRTDDGVGPRVAAAVSSWGLPGLMAIAAQQLTPELAEPLAAVGLALFVDARLAGDDDALEILTLQPSDSMGPAGHASDPRSLLALARAVYGRWPPARLIAVPAQGLSMGARLSPGARRRLAAAR